MPVPEATSATGLAQYIGGQCIAAGRGEAWKEVQAWIVSLPSEGRAIQLPSVSEPFLAWTVSGEVEFQEREGRNAWLVHRIGKGSFFLTFGGAPYEVRWRSLTSEPFVGMSVVLGLPLMRQAFDEVHGAEAAHVRLRDISAFRDEGLSSLMEALRGELGRVSASPLYVRGIGLAMAVHLARNYADTSSQSRGASPSLPGFKLKQITEWMADHPADDFNLDQLASRVALSKFHFHRLFKKATGVSPSRYQANLRMEIARRLLRETSKSVVEVALEVGYANPSHFAQLFRRQTGLSPTDYRRQS